MVSHLLCLLCTHDGLWDEMDHLVIDTRGPAHIYVDEVFVVFAVQQMYL